MPEAIPFSYKGIDRGFPFRVLPNSISWNFLNLMSLQQVGELFWNLYGASGAIASASFDDGSLQLHAELPPNAKINLVNAPQPRERALLTNNQVLTASMSDFKQGFSSVLNRNVYVLYLAEVELRTDFRDFSNGEFGRLLRCEVRSTVGQAGSATVYNQQIIKLDSAANGPFSGQTISNVTIGGFPFVEIRTENGSSPYATTVASNFTSFEFYTYPAA